MCMTTKTWMGDAERSKSRVLNRDEFTEAHLEPWIPRQLHSRSQLDAGVKLAPRGPAPHCASRASLEELQEPLHRLVSLTPAIACELDPEGITLFVSDPVTSITGYQIDELLGKNWWNVFFPGEQHQQVRDLYGKVRVGNVAGYEMDLTARDGSVRTVLWTTANEYLPDGRLARIKAVGVDVTEREPARASLWEDEQRYRVMVETANQGIWVIDAECNTIFVNGRLAEMLGYSASEMLGVSLFAFVKEDMIASITEKMKRRRKGVKEEYDFPLLRKDGSEIWTLVCSTPLFDSQGRFSGSMGMLTDITERKRAEDALRESEEWLRSVVQTATDAIVCTDVHGTITSWNQHAEAIFGYGAQEICGRSTSVLIPERLREAWKTGFQRLVTTPHSASGQATLAVSGLRKDGSEFPAELSIASWSTSQGVFFMAIVRDVTEEKLAEERIKQGRDRILRILEETIQAIAGMVEMRDPYTAGHQERVTELACAIATEMGLSDEQIYVIRLCASIHDLGKVNLPAEILCKPGKLSKTEFDLIKEHPALAYSLVKKIDFPWPVAQIVFQHHERLNGSGYPLGLTGDNILLEARILGVADVVEAMASHRPYRPALGVDQALKEIEQWSGILYDLEAVNACLRLFIDKGFTWTTIVRKSDSA